jgi:RND family efflux transporter MFP subunit
MAGCQQKNTFVAPPPPQVTVAQPTEEPVVEFLEFTGTTKSTAEVDIRARVNGYLKKIAFDDGAQVEKGDLLFVIDPAPFEVDLESKQAALQKAQATLLLADANLARAKKLEPLQAVSEEEVDIRAAERATAAAGVASANADLRQAELTLNYTEVRSPIKGRVGRHLVDQGALVQAEQTLLASVESIDPIYAYFSVSESEFLRLRELHGQKETGKERATELQLAIGDAGNYAHQGLEDFEELGVDPQTGTVMRRDVFPNDDHQLLPGLFVRIRTAVSEPKPRILIEERALGADQRGDYVLVVNSKNVVEYRPVKLGMSVNGKRVVEGVKRDEWIVVNGLQRARPGGTVDPQKSSETAVSSLSAASDASTAVAQRDDRSAKE